MIPMEWQRIRLLSPAFMVLIAISLLTAGCEIGPLEIRFKEETPTADESTVEAPRPTQEETPLAEGATLEGACPTREGASSAGKMSSEVVHPFPEIQATETTEPSKSFAEILWGTTIPDGSRDLDVVVQEGGLTFFITQVSVENGELWLDITARNFGEDWIELHYGDNWPPLLQDQQFNNYAVLNIGEKDTLCIERGGELVTRWNFGKLPPTAVRARLGINLARSPFVVFADVHEPSFWSPTFYLSHVKQEGRVGSVEPNVSVQVDDVTITVDRVVTDGFGIEVHYTVNNQGDGVFFLRNSSDRPFLLDDEDNAYVIDFFDSGDVKSIFSRAQESDFVRFYPIPEAGRRLTLIFNQGSSSPYSPEIRIEGIPVP